MVLLVGMDIGSSLFRSRLNKFGVVRSGGRSNTLTLVSAYAQKLRSMSCCFKLERAINRGRNGLYSCYCE